MKNMTRKLFKTIFVTLCVVIFCDLTFAGNEIPENVKNKIDEAVAEFISINKSPSLCLSVVKLDGDILYTNGYGLRNIEENLTADSSTLYGIGSISKSFLAVIIVKVLHEKYPDLGESVLDTPIRQLIPCYNFTLSDRYRSENTNFRDLLSHRVGLFPDALGLSLCAFAEQKDFLYGLRYAPVKSSFRTSYVYNNGHVTMAADIISHIANSTYEKLLFDLLTDIGMEHTTIIRESDDHNNMINRSVPYFIKDEKIQRFNASLFKCILTAIPISGIISNANDMAKYMKFHLNLGKVDSVQIVPQDVIKWLHKPSNLYTYGALKTEESEPYYLDYASGLCMNLGTYDGWLRVGHGGFFPPYDSFMSFYPEAGVGIFTATNGPKTSFLTNYTKVNLNHRIFDALRGSQKSSYINTHLKGENDTTVFRPAKSSISVFEIKGNTKRTTRIKPSEIVGSFGNGMSGQLSIFLKENSTGGFKPYLNYGLWGKGWMSQVSNSTFAVHWETDFTQLVIAQSFSDKIEQFGADFSNENSFHFIADGNPITAEFIRNQTVDTLKVIPWEADSC